MSRNNIKNQSSKKFSCPNFCTAHTTGLVWQRIEKATKYVYKRREREREREREWDRERERDVQLYSLYFVRRILRHFKMCKSFQFESDQSRDPMKVQYNGCLIT